MENSVSVYSPTSEERKLFLARTYGWMGIALLVSAASAVLAAYSGLILSLLRATGGLGMIALIIAELAVVIILSSSIRKISVLKAKAMFLLYAALSGLTLSTIFFVYRLSSVGSCFISASALFFVMAAYGMKTKSDLTSAGSYLRMGLIGIIIASLINGLMFMLGFGSGMFSWLISLVSVIVFTGLTAYDSQKILRASLRADSSDDYRKIAIFGALELYLDFINIFLSLLRLFGKRR